MILKYGGGIVEYHGDYLAVAFFGYLKAAGVEGQHRLFAFVSGAFGEDGHRNAVLYLIGGIIYGLHSLAQIVAIKEFTVEQFHPPGQSQEFKQFFLCDISAESGYAGISQYDIKEAVVI